MKRIVADEEVCGVCMAVLTQGSNCIKRSSHPLEYQHGHTACTKKLANKNCHRLFLASLIIHTRWEKQ